MKLVDILARELKVWPEGVKFITQQGGGYLFDEGNYPLDILVSTADDNLTRVVERSKWQAAVDALRGSGGIDWSTAPFDAEAGILETPHVYGGWFRKDGKGHVQQICPSAGVKVWQWMGGRTDFPVGHELRPSVVTERIGPDDCSHLWAGWSDTEACELCNKTRKIVVEWSGDGLPPVGVVCEYRLKPSNQWHECEIRYHMTPSDFGELRAVAWNPDLKFDQVSNSNWEFRPIRTPEQIAAEERDAGIQALKQIFDSCSDELMPTSNKYLDTLFGAIYDAGYRKLEIVDN